MAKMKTCKSCGAEISKSAKTCPKCGARQKKPVLLIVVVAILVIGIIGAIGGSPKAEKVGETGTQAPAQSQAPVQSQAPAQDKFQVGDVVSLNDVEVTLLNVTESSGGNYMTPEDGNVFILCEFEISNGSSKDIAVSSLLSFEAYVDDYTTSMSLTATISADKTQLDGTVAAGKKMNGAIGYEAPQDWKELEIRFTPDFWSGKDIIFTYSK